MSKLIQNAWYAAAWSEEITRDLFVRTILNTPLVFFRTEAGAPVALLDRCPHRFVPLSGGKLDGDHLVCGYHGLRFDARGACVDKRFNEIVRDNAQLPSFPLVEKDSILWIWMGDRAADPAAIPDFFPLVDPKRTTVRATTHIKANYALEIDNLMDLTHLDFVHLATIGTGIVSTGVHDVRQEGERVHSDWWVPNTQCPPQFEPYVQAGGRPVDHWLDLRWDPPGSIFLDVGVTLAGAPREQGYTAEQAHLLTPETETTTHYLWAVSRPDLGEPPAVSDFVREFTRKAFEEEDRPMIEAAQARMKSGDFWAERPVIFPQDAGAIRARRVLDRLAEAEALE